MAQADSDHCAMSTGSGASSVARRAAATTAVTAPPARSTAGNRQARTSDALDDGRDAHPSSDAQSDEGGGFSGPLELVEGGVEQHGAGGAQRVAERDGAAVDVHPRRIDAELAD